MIKVIHVHLIFERKDYYFGSVSAVYNKLNERQVGIAKSTLLHSGLAEKGSIVTQRAIIKQGQLIRGGN